MNLKKVIYEKLQSMTVDQFQKFLEKEKQGYLRITSHPEDEDILIVNDRIIDITNAVNNDIKILAKFSETDECVSYFFNNQLHFATREGFTTQQALKATEIWNEKYSKHTTPIYFLYTISVKVVNLEDLAMLGMIDLRDGDELETVLVEAIAEHFGMPFDNSNK